MSPRTAESRSSSLWARRLGICSAGAAGAVGIVAFVVWAVGEPALRCGCAAAFRMPPAAAVAFAAAGLGLVLSVPEREVFAGARVVGRVLGALVAALGATVLLEYGTGLTLIDDVLFADRLRLHLAGEVPGRPSLHVAIGLLLCGLSLVVLDADAARGHRPSRVLAPATVLAGTMAVLGDLYGADYLQYGSPARPGTSLTAGGTLALLAVGVVLARPDRPPAHLYIGSGPGGRVMRRLAPAVTGILIVAVLLTATGRSDLPVDEGFVVTVATAMVMVSLYLVFLRAGAAMDVAELARRAEQDYSQGILDALPDGVITISFNGVVQHVTPRWTAITGYPASEVIGLRPPYPWWPVDHEEAMYRALRRLPPGRLGAEVNTVVRRADGVLIDVHLTLSLLYGSDGAKKVVATYRDLTDRNAEDAEWRRVTSQVDQFFDMSGDLLCITGPNGYFTRLNPAWERALGFTIEELKSRPYLDFVHPDDYGRTMRDAYEELARGVKVVNFENRYVCRDGSYRWLNWSASMVDGDTSIYAVARDTTDQREADRNQAFLAAIVGSTDDAVIGKTLDGIIVSWNDAAERMYGYRAEEMIGQSIRILTPPENAGEIDDILDRIRRGEPVARLDSIRCRADGSRVHVGLTISPIRDKDGSIVGAASIARDITSRLAAEQRFSRLVQAAPDAMIIVDGTGTITLANEQTGRLFGYPSSELIGASVEQLVPDYARERHIRHREGYLAAPHNLLMGSGMELSGLRSDGSEFPIEISLAPLQTDEGTMISGAIRDISKRREVEQALASARDDAIAAARLKSQFVAVVSHEIRTPMNGVIGLSGLLLRTALDATQRRYAEAIQISARALLTIINDILDFSKIEAGKVQLASVDFALGELLETVVELAAEAGHETDLEIGCAYPPGLDVVVRGDDGRLRQALLNLVGNAVKFTERGQVVLRAELAVPPDGGVPGVAFSVTDTGLGIAESELPRLFEPFTQVDARSSREFGGTGLGLTISRQLVALMGGELQARSRLGAGSEFSFTLPLSPLAESSADGGRPVAPDFAGRHLIIGDASGFRRRLFQEHVSAWGCGCTDAGDAHAALAALAAAAAGGWAYDVAVVDERLLEAGGAELAGRIAARAGAAGTRIVLTANPSRDGHHLASWRSAVSLSKPVGPRRLYDCLLHLWDPDQGRSTLPEVPATPGRPGAERRLVLLAEDNRINQMVATDLLESLGYDFDVAENGGDVLRLAGTKPYQAILMDCQMPRMDGYAAAAALREREGPGEHLPIIAMTAGALAEDRDRCLAAGMDDYLTKPIEPEALRGALDRWIEAANAVARP